MVNPGVGGDRRWGNGRCVLPATTRQTDLATTAVRRHVDPTLTVTHTRPMPGGSVSTVLDWQTDGQPGNLIAKLAGRDRAHLLREEHVSLTLYRHLGVLPAPEPLAWSRWDPDLEASVLIMEKLPGQVLSEARLSDAGQSRLQRTLADHLIALHGHTVDRFGVAGELKKHGQSRWLDLFGPMLEEQWARGRPRLASRVRPIGDELLRHLDRWLPETAQPTLVHGDLWMSNILVDDSHPDHPAITGYVDSIARYLDREYELAYLRLFATADRQCLSRYQAARPLQPGYERRFRVYWLHTLLMHLETFGTRYRPACERTLRALRRSA